MPLPQAQQQQIEGPPHCLVLRCFGCGEIMAMAEPADRLYGRAPLAFCDRECLLLGLRKVVKESRS